MSMLEPFVNWLSDRREESIGIRSTTRWIWFVIVFICIIFDEWFPSSLHFFSCTRSIPYEESIRTFDDLIGWIFYIFSIDEEIEIFCLRDCIYITEWFDDVSFSYSPSQIRKEISPGRCCHVDMDESSLVLMEVDTILRFHVFGDIASKGLFHIVICREVLTYSVDIDCEVRMPVYLVWSRDEYIRESDTDNESDDEEESFFHN